MIHQFASRFSIIKFNEDWWNNKKTKTYEKDEEIDEINDVKIMQIVQSNDCINFVIEDFDNINQKRITNLFCCFEKNIYYLCNENIFDVKHEIDVLTKWLDDKMRFYSGENIKRINSYATDIEPKMQGIYSILIVQKDFKHVFWVFCDSHDIQFLMKNTFELSWFIEIFKKVVEFVIYFHRNGKQINVLRKCQKKIYDRHYSIMLNASIWFVNACLSFDSLVHWINSLLFNRSILFFLLFATKSFYRFMFSIATKI